MFFRPIRRLRSWVAAAATAALLAGGPGLTPRARADEKDDLRELRLRIEALEKQNQALMRLLEQPTSVSQDRAGAVAGPGNDDVKKVVDDYLKEKDEKKKAEVEQKQHEAEEQGYTVGDDFGLTFKWDNGPWAETKDKAFRFHLGGRTQYDTVFYNVGDNVQFGNNGVGRVDDGMAFRRARLTAEGTIWEVINFEFSYDFLNTDTLAQNVNLIPTRNAAGVLTNVEANRAGRIIDTPVPTDMWVEVTKLPVVGNVRIGNQKPPISFEHVTSSRFLNFLERSYGFDAYIGGPDNGFSPGVVVYRNFLDDRLHFSTGITKFNQTIFGFNTGDGEYASTTRLGVFPVWADDGRYALWVGCAYQHADPDFLVTGNRQFSRQTDGQVRLRARTQLRNGPAELQTPLLDIFPFGSSRDLVVPEFALVCGPWTVQGEYYGHWLHDARARLTDSLGVTQFTQGAFVEVLYFLTGEHRALYRPIPRFDRVVPHEPFFLVDGCDGGKLFGRGAWQVGIRYSWIDLADQNVLGGNNIIGQAQAVTFGLNWFLNPNMKLQWNYTYESRYQVNTVTGPNAGLLPNQSSDGDLRGFGMRMAIDF